MASFHPRLLIFKRLYVVFWAFGIALPGEIYGETLTVFAASSLQGPLDEILIEFETADGDAVVVSYAASSALARQIANGAPADVFLSADLDWVDWLGEQNAIDTKTRATFTHNHLVLIRAQQSPAHKSDNVHTVLQGLSESIAIAETQSVPAGRYAKYALENLGVWSNLAPFVIPTRNVRHALWLVDHGEVDYGIVYASDAELANNLGAIWPLPTDVQPEINYEAAATNGALAGAARFINYLTSSPAHDVFIRYGFRELTP